MIIGQNLNSTFINLCKELVDPLRSAQPRMKSIALMTFNKIGISALPSSVSERLSFELGLTVNK